jgi:hypothetical protein
VPLPDPLPARFEAVLHGRVRAVIAHSLLDGGRQTFEAPSGGEPLAIRAAVDREAGTLRITEFPAVGDEVDTAVGSVHAVVTVEGEPAGRYHGDDGHVEIDAPIHVEPDSFLASDSDATLALSTSGAVRQPDLDAHGDPVDDGDATVRLVGEGTFRGGSLDGGTMWIAIDCTIDAIEEA